MAVAKAPRSKKAKGNRLEIKVAEAYRHYKIDETARRMPMSGAISTLKGDIFKRNDIGWVDECKNQEKVQLWAWWEQAANQAKGLQKPVLHISGNYRPTLTVMKLEDYMHLRACEKQLEELLNGTR